jgi:hypothetical protein
MALTAQASEVRQDVAGGQADESVTGTTVIVHGFQLTGTVPDWPFHLAEAIRARAGEGRIFEYDPGTGDLLPCAHPACGPQAAGGETVIVFDWAADSAESGTGFSEAAAEALLAGLVRWTTQDPPLAGLEHLHLIGHSRGAVVASEVAERIIAAGLPAPDRLTSLDPHDTGAFEIDEEGREPDGLWDDLDVNDLHPEYQCALPPGTLSGVCSWQGVGYHDNYWRDQDGWPCFVDPDGKVVPGASDFDGSGLDDFCHSDVHAWYWFTIDTSAATHPETGDPPGVDWFDPANTSCDVSQRTWPLARSIDGYNSTRIGGGTVRCPTDPGAQQRVLFDFNLAEGLVNGNFEKQPSSAAIAGWQFHGGGGTAGVANDGDRYLRLDAGQWRRHNRFVVPHDAVGLRFCRSVLVSGGGDVVTINLHQADGSRPLYEEDPTAVSSWRCFDVDLDAAERGRPAAIEVSVYDDGAPPVARVGIDDIRLLVGVFFDGFESGDASRWTSVQP